MPARYALSWSSNFLAREVPRSGRAHSGLLEQIGHLAARVEHAGLHGRRRHSDNARHLVDRLLVIIDEIDHFAMRGRERLEALLNDIVAVLVADQGLGIIRGVLDGRRHLVIKMLVGPPPQRRERLVTGNGEEPSGYLRLAFEALSLAPHVEEYLADEVFGQRRVAGEAENEAIHAHIVARVEHLHRALIA